MRRVLSVLLNTPRAAITPRFASGYNFSSLPVISKPLNSSASPQNQSEKKFAMYAYPSAASVKGSPADSARRPTDSTKPAANHTANRQKNYYMDYKKARSANARKKYMRPEMMSDDWRPVVAVPAASSFSDCFELASLKVKQY